MVKERETVEAAAKLPLPPCEAVMVQVPAATSVRVEPLLPLVVQMEVVDEEKETVRPEDAVAERGSTLIPKVLLAREAKVMVWVAVVTVSVAVIVAVS